VSGIHVRVDFSVWNTVPPTSIHTIQSDDDDDDDADGS